MDEYELKLKAFELSMDIARLPKPLAAGNNGLGYSTPAADSVEVILTRAAMIETYLLGQ